MRWTVHPGSAVTFTRTAPGKEPEVVTGVLVAYIRDERNDICAVVKANDRKLFAEVMHPSWVSAIV